MLLIYPPVAKPCEPPGGIGRLSGALKQYGVDCHVVDAGLEGLLFLLACAENSSDPSHVSRKDRWTTRAMRGRVNHLDLLRSPAGYENFDRYKRAVMDLNHLLDMVGRNYGVKLSLSNYQDPVLSPLKSKDLIRAAAAPEKNPFYDYYQRRLPDFLGKDSDGIVGISIQYLSQALCGFSLIGTIRQMFPEKKIVLGGGLVTSWMKQRTWQNPFVGLVDEMVAGPGEAALLAINGIKDPQSDLSAYPDYAPFPLKGYLSPGLILPYSASSGCFWNKCSFCPEKAEGNSFVPVPPKKVIADLKHLKKEMKPVMIHFLDNAMTPALLKALASSPPGAPWYGFARMTAPLTDIDFCRDLKDAGCVMLKLGLESGDQNVLDGLNKGIDLKKASNILHNLEKTGIATFVYLLFGTPQEDEAAAGQTLDFVVRHHECIQFLNLAVFNLPADHPDAAGMNAKPFSDTDLHLYGDFVHPKAWDRKAVRQFLYRKFRRQPQIAEILRRTPPFFTSNHAAFFVTENTMK